MHEYHSSSLHFKSFPFLEILVVLEFCEFCRFTLRHGQSVYHSSLYLRSFLYLRIDNYTMSTETEVKLLTLLNVSAIKRPRDMDVPGGQRGSRGSSSPLPPPASAPASGSRVDSSVPAKKRKSVIFGGELGPSGSTYGKNQNKKAKAAATSVNGNGNGNGKGKEKEKEQGMNGHAEEEDDAELDNGSDDEEEETSGASGTYHPPPLPR